MTITSLQDERKEEVIKIVERWFFQYILPSKQSNDRDSSTAVALVIDVADALGEYVENYDNKVAVITKKTREYEKSAIIPGKMRGKIKFILSNIEKDKQVMSFSYDEFMFFLHWLRRIY